MILPIAYYGEKILRQKTSAITEITPEIRELIKNMFETMYAYKGIGIAAPQVFQSVAIFVTAVPDYENEENPKPTIERVFINPKILKYSEEVCIESEACLSIPKVRGEVERPIEITVEAMDLNGALFQQTFFDYEARCIMHELDHLNGKLYVDRLDAKQKRDIEPKLKALKKQKT